MIFAIATHGVYVIIPQRVCFANCAKCEGNAAQARVVTRFAYWIILIIKTYIAIARICRRRETSVGQRITRTACAECAGTCALQATEITELTSESIRDIIVMRLALALVSAQEPVVLIEAL